jgi:HsdR family type I site-specific deoxyribonuclease
VDQDIDGDGKKKPQTVRFIDWDNLYNNEFLVTRQFKVQGPNEKAILDIVIFINGIPVVVLECKSPFLEQSKNEKMGKYEAYEQLRRYMDARDSEKVEGAPRLFYTNFFTGILNKYHAYVGTISSRYGHYKEWKDPYPFRKEQIEDVEDFGQNLFLQGLLEKNNLLDIMRNFLLYEADNESGTKIKKICRYQQFRAVNKTIERLKNGRDSLSRGGVIWHTQGSGKSLTMVFLARKIRRIPELMDATIVVVTDRIDLDKQIYNTFVRTLSTITTPVRAETVKEMKELLSLAQPQIIMTTIQKFQSEKEETEVLKDSRQESSLYYEKEFPVLTTKSNVIVLTDEAHRSQYKGMARNMREGLPNAAFIGFTGTPIDKEDRSTPRTFGSYIDKYGIQQAVDDEATVRIVYEGRRSDLQIKGDTLEELFEQAFEDKTEEEKEAIKQKYANKRTIVEADSRIEDIAQDLLEHYKQWVYPNGFKAQVVCVSREACVKYYNALVKKLEPEKELDISDCGEKVKKLISEHLESLGLQQWIKPVTLFDSDFKGKVNTLKSDEAVASAMEHAIKHVIHVKMDDNPVYYTSLLEKLKQILEETKNNWIERKKRLEEFIQNDVQKGEIREAEALGLTREEFAFFEVVKQHLEQPQEEVKDGVVREAGAVYVSQSLIDLAKDIARNVADIIRKNYVIDWAANASKTADIERAIYLLLNTKYFKQIRIEVRKQLVQPLLQLAKKHFSVLE